jgi:hypothetical protein
METSSLNTCHDFYRYLDFAENRHLQALTNLCQNTDDQNLYSLLIAHKEEIAEAIRRRRHLLEDLDGHAIAHEAGDYARSHGRVMEEASV